MTKRKYKRYSNKYKARILQEYAELKHGECGAFLREHGITAAHINSWRNQLGDSAPSRAVQQAPIVPQPGTCYLLENGTRAYLRKVMDGTLVWRLPGKIVHLDAKRSKAMLEGAKALTSQDLDEGAVFTEPQ